MKLDQRLLGCTASALILFNAKPLHCDYCASMTSCHKGVFITLETQKYSSDVHGNALVYTSPVE